MRRSPAQWSLILLAGAAFMIAALVGIAVRQQAASADRSTCVLERRHDWEVSIGEVVGHGARHPGQPLPSDMLDRYDAAQSRNAAAGDACPLKPWWRP